MTLFRFLWLRRLIRRNMTPIPEDRAGLWKTRLSILYAVLAWNAFGFVCYEIYSGKADWAKYYGLKSEEELNVPNALQWTRTLGIKNATVISVDGLNVTKYKIKDDEIAKEE